MMKNKFFLCCILSYALFIAAPMCYAQKIYLKGGQVIDSEILYRSKNSIWLKDKSHSAGIDISRIEKIVNEDGSISKYDYESLRRNLLDFISQKKYTAAASTCGILLEAFPEDTQLIYLRGLLNQKSGNLRKAREDYTDLINKKAANAKIFNNLGAIYANEKAYQEAIKLITQAAAENPGMAEAHNNLAELFMQARNYSRAIEEYNKVLELEPDNVNALYSLGLAYESSSEPVKAKEQWDKILAISPDDKDAKKALEYLKEKGAKLK